MRPITLITDFGLKDHYVGAMKGTILRVAPTATIVDITHEIEPHDIVQAAFVLRQAIGWFPAGSVHAVIVDPGVGTARRILAGRFSGQVVIAPDNGLVSLVQRDLRVEEICSVENNHYFPGVVSHTFHGRDIIAPVAAHVASGVPLSRLGPRVGRLEVLQLPVARRVGTHEVHGCVLHVDRFGNLITNIPAADVTQRGPRVGPVEVSVDGQPVGPLRNAYGDVPVAEPVALIGSGGTVEVSVHCGRAADRFHAQPNTPVVVRWKPA